MSGTPAADLAAFHDLEHRNWERAVAAYDRGWGALTAQCLPTLLSAVGCASGVRLLDVATGPGVAAEAAAKAGAEVTAVDFSAKMLELARERLGAACGGRVQLVEADAASLPFPDASFDAVACSFGVLHLPRPEAFFQEAARVLRPGGKLAFTVWAPPPKTQAFELILACVKKHGNPDVALPAGPPFFRFADPDEAARCLGDAGFAGVTTTEVRQRWELPGADDPFVAFRDGTGRTAALLAGQTAEQLLAVETAMREGAEARRAPSGGPVQFEMPCMLTVATKPAATPSGSL